MYRTTMIQLPLMVKEPSNTVVRTPQDVMAICKDIQMLMQESFHVLSLDVRNKMIDRHIISLGLKDSTLIAPPEVFRPAILNNAAAIILVHNHPTGDPTPSAEDMRVTKQLCTAGELLGIKILDHIIIGKKPLSMREAGVVKFGS